MVGTSEITVQNYLGKYLHGGKTVETPFLILSLSNKMKLLMFVN
jgi:hypothetical protein